MDWILGAMAVFVAYPVLAGVIGLILIGLGRAVRRRTPAVMGAIWLLYALYETGMQKRWLCSGECNIRIDLLLIYPALLFALVLALVSLILGARARGLFTLLLGLLLGGVTPLIPEGSGRPLPIILVRTPLGAARELPSTELPPQYKELAEDGYIFVTSRATWSPTCSRPPPAATPIPSHTVTPFTVDLHQQLYRFQKGHGIMVQVQSTWVSALRTESADLRPNIFHAKPSDFRAQEHRIWHSARYPSHVSLQVLP